MHTSYANERIGSEVTPKLEQAALKGFARPFNGFLSDGDLERRVAVYSMDMETGQQLIEAVTQEWYRKLKPSVRKKFNLKLT